MIDIIANRYAEALFQLSEEENITKEIYKELRNVVELVKGNKELDNVLKSPLVAKNEKIQLIEVLKEFMCSGPELAKALPRVKSGVAVDESADNTVKDNIKDKKDSNNNIEMQMKEKYKNLFRR